MTEKTEAVVFDLFDTLIYLGRYTRVHQRILQELGLNQDESRKARRLAMTEDFYSIADYAQKIAPNSAIDAQKYEKEITEEVATATPFPETVETLTSLRGKGLKLGVISNLETHYINPFFDLGLDKLVDSYLLSCRIGIMKPDARIYQKMADELMLKPQNMLMTGDSEYCDVKGPEAIGMNAVLLDRHNKSNSQKKIITLDEITKYLVTR